MVSDSVIVTLMAIGFVFVVIYLANRAMILGIHDDELLKLGLGVVVVSATIYVLLVAIGLLLVSSDQRETTLDVLSTVIYTVFAIAASFAGWLFSRSMIFRRRLRNLLPHSAEYDPTSPIHTTAVVLSLGFVVITLGNFISEGGIRGLAENLEVYGITWSDVLYSQMLWFLAAGIGIGLWIRRTLTASILRLGLRMPTSSDIRWGISGGIAMVVVSFVFTLFWLHFVPINQFDAQTAASAQLAQSFATLPEILALSILVGLGEEIFFVVRFSQYLEMC